ncbi:MAG: hypothetical protein ACOCXP_01965 [Candidatus Dojkabacteria bacterium]
MGSGIAEEQHLTCPTEVRMQEYAAAKYPGVGDEDLPVKPFPKWLIPDSSRPEEIRMRNENAMTSLSLIKGLQQKYLLAGQRNNYPTENEHDPTSDNEDLEHFNCAIGGTEAHHHYRTMINYLDNGMYDRVSLAVVGLHDVYKVIRGDSFLEFENDVYTSFGDEAGVILASIKEFNNYDDKLAEFSRELESSLFEPTEGISIEEALKPCNFGRLEKGIAEKIPENLLLDFLSMAAKRPDGEDQLVDGRAVAAALFANAEDNSHFPWSRAEDSESKIRANLRNAIEANAILEVVANFLELPAAVRATQMCYFVALYPSASIALKEAVNEISCSRDGCSYFDHTLDLNDRLLKRQIQRLGHIEIVDEYTYLKRVHAYLLGENNYMVRSNEVALLADKKTIWSFFAKILRDYSSDQLHPEITERINQDGWDDPKVWEDILMRSYDVIRYAAVISDEIAKEYLYGGGLGFDGGDDTPHIEKMLVLDQGAEGSAPFVNHYAARPARAPKEGRPKATGYLKWIYDAEDRQLGFEAHSHLYCTYGYSPRPTSGRLAIELQVLNDSAQKYQRHGLNAHILYKLKKKGVHLNGATEEILNAYNRHVLENLNYIFGGSFSVA